MKLTLQLVVGGMLVIILLGVGRYFLRRQMRVLRDLREGRLAGSDREHAHLRRQANRRIWCGGLMVLLGALLSGALVFLEVPAQHLADAGVGENLDPDERAFLRFYGWYWIVFLVVLLLLLVFAGQDYWATYRYAQEERKRIREARRALIAEEVQRMREDRG